MTTQVTELYLLSNFITNDKYIFKIHVFVVCLWIRASSTTFHNFLTQVTTEYSCGAKALTTRVRTLRH